MIEIMQGDARQIPFNIVNLKNEIVPESQIEAIEVVFGGMRFTYPDGGISCLGDLFSIDLTQEKTLTAVPGFHELQYRIKAVNDPEYVQGNETCCYAKIRKAKSAEVI